MKFCPICGVQVFGSLKFCSKEHRDQHWSKMQKERYASRKRTKTFDKECCICGKPYQSKSVLSKVCQNKKCRNKYDRNAANKRISALTDEQRKAYYRKRYHKVASLQKESFKLSGEVVECVCPGCGVRHEFRFEPAWIGRGTPRKNCPRYPYCISYELRTYGVCDISGKGNEARV